MGEAKIKKIEKMKTVKRGMLAVLLVCMLLLAVGLCFPTWTPKIAGKDSISELRKVKINDTELEVMIRGNNRENPVIVFAHGGPCCSEIPYVRKYQDLLEKDFTIVHYDQRGSGKSYQFGTDYTDVTAQTHVEDLIALTKYIEEYLGQKQVILMGHSYGTYIATMAAAKAPELYRVYVGIGQMSDTIKSELSSLGKCMEAAQKAGKADQVTYLGNLKETIEKGEAIVPRSISDFMWRQENIRKLWLWKACKNPFQILLQN